MKHEKGTGRTIVATARNISGIVWCMLTADEPFDPSLMIDTRLNQKADSMRAALRITA
ncbi:MAG: hypothetical protein ABSF43_05445 [Rectinemataceae bacterium]|jgi:hypothetical protein